MLSLKVCRSISSGEGDVLVTGARLIPSCVSTIIANIPRNDKHTIFVNIYEKTTIIKRPWSAVSLQNRKDADDGI
jgi:hypothetical protein